MKKLIKAAELQELMKEPLIKAIVDDRVEEIKRCYGRPRKGFTITVKEPK